MGTGSARPDQSALGAPPVQADQVSFSVSVKPPNLGRVGLKGVDFEEVVFEELVFEDVVFKEVVFAGGVG